MVTYPCRDYTFISHSAVCMITYPRSDYIFIPHFTGHMITYPCRHWSKAILKRAPRTTLFGIYSISQYVHSCVMSLRVYYQFLVICMISFTTSCRVASRALWQFVTGYLQCQWSNPEEMEQIEQVNKDNKKTRQTNKQMKGQSEIAYLPKFANMMLIVMVIVITEILYIILIFDCFENQ